MILVHASISLTERSPLWSASTFSEIHSLKTGSSNPLSSVSEMDEALFAFGRNSGSESSEISEISDMLSGSVSLQISSEILASEKISSETVLSETVLSETVPSEKSSPEIAHEIWASENHIETSFSWDGVIPSADSKCYMILGVTYSI